MPTEILTGDKTWCQRFILNSPAELSCVCGWVRTACPFLTVLKRGDWNMWIHLLFSLVWGMFENSIVKSKKEESPDSKM